MLMDASVLGGRAEVLALQVESCSPGLLRLARHRASGECGHSAGFWPQGQYNHRTPLVAGRRNRRQRALCRLANGVRNIRFGPYIRDTVTSVGLAREHLPTWSDAAAYLAWLRREQL